MRAKVLRSFVSNQPRFRASAGEIIEMPEDVDWVKAGFVEILPDEPKPEIDLAELAAYGVDKKYQNKFKRLVEDASLKTPEKATIRSTGKQPTKKPASKPRSRKTVK